MQGIIVKGIGGFYYVKTENELIECKARGKFRFNELTPMVGDSVDIEVNGEKGVINKIHKRKNQLVRPPVANITQAFIVFCFENPEINLDLLNKFLVQCEANDIKVIVCFNKIDIVNLDTYAYIIKMLELAKYETILLSAKNSIGIDKITQKLENNVSVLCGPSGVGKSTILNKVSGRELMETGNISEKLSRGKHTTRHCELIECNNGLIVDTPGFSSFEIETMEKDQLQYCFPEFIEFIGECKFNGCLHNKEPECSIKTAVKKGIISELRYDFYIKTLEELTNRRMYK